MVRGNTDRLYREIAQKPRMYFMRNKVIYSFIVYAALMNGQIIITNAFWFGVSTLLRFPRSVWRKFKSGTSHTGALWGN